MCNLLGECPIEAYVPGTSARWIMSSRLASISDQSSHSRVWVIGVAPLDRTHGLSRFGLDELLWGAHAVAAGDGSKMWFLGLVLVTPVERRSDLDVVTYPWERAGALAHGPAILNRPSRSPSLRILTIAKPGRIVDTVELDNPQPSTIA